MINVISISAFGVLGVLSRYGVDAVFSRMNAPFALSTLVINAAGSFLAGALYALSTAKDYSPLQLGLMVGFCGGFTTFSAYTVQALSLLEKGKVFPAFAYLFGSPLLGVVAAFIPVLIFKNFASAT